MGEGLEPTAERLHLQTGRGSGAVEQWGGGEVWEGEGGQVWAGVEVWGGDEVMRCEEAQDSVQGAEVQRYRGAEVHAEV